MKLQLTPVFGGLVVGTGGIVVSYTNGTYTFSLSGQAPITVSGDAAIAALTQAVAVTRNNPVTTNLQLPDVNLQNGIPLFIFDWSTNVVNHQINLTPFAGQTIMRQLTWPIFSAGAALGWAALRPASNLSGWFLT